MDEFRAWNRFLNFIRDHGIPDDLGYALEDYDKELLKFLWCIAHPEDESCGARIDWHDLNCIVVRDSENEERQIRWLCGIVVPPRECVEQAVGEYVARYGLQNKITITIEQGRCWVQG